MYHCLVWYVSSQLFLMLCLCSAITDGGRLMSWNLQHNTGFSFPASSDGLSGPLAISEVSCKDCLAPHCLASVAVLIHGGRFHSLFLFCFSCILRDPRGTTTWATLLILSDCLKWRLAPWMTFAGTTAVISLFIVFRSRNFSSLLFFHRFKDEQGGNFPWGHPSFYSSVNPASP